MTVVKASILSILLCCPAITATAQQAIVDLFEAGTHTFEGFTLPYRLFVPVDYDSTKAYPLVLALHGAGERGTDNERHIRPHRLATAWADPVNQARYPTFVVAPQVPPGGRWTADRPVAESSFNAEELTTLDLLDSLAVAFNIDPNRVYVTGLSMGGHGAWDLVSRLPDRFAAAVPMSGNADPTQAAKLLHLPIWTFHGETDTVVPAAGARGLIQAMENLGREVVYTDCRRAPPLATNFDCPGTLPGAALAQAIEDHADLIFTSVRAGGHGPWNVWYDHPQLFAWMFSKYRVDPNAIALETPLQSAVWSGINAVTWTTDGPATDSVEVWLSLDNGRTWQAIDEAGSADGTYAFDTSAYADTPFAKVRLFVRNVDGLVYGRHTSDPFVIDNDGDAPPYLRVEDEPLRFNPTVVAETIELVVLAADPERSALTTTLYYSVDGGRTYALVQSVDLASSQDPQTLTVDLAALPNAAEAHLRIEVSDGTHTMSATTVPFVKETPRSINDYVEHIEGEGIGTITLRFIEPENLTAHRYRITFDDTDPAAKTYSVVDLDLSTTVLADEPLSDGVRESPLFDGMRLVVQDLEAGAPDLEKTGWIVGNSDLGVTITGGRVLVAVLSVQLLDTEDEYEFTMTDAVADTSVTLFGFPATNMRFTVTARSDGQRRKVLYRDVANDGRPGNRDVLYILEDDAAGQPAPAWEFRFNSTSSTVLPQTGDTFLFVPLHKLSARDVFEYVAAVGVAVEEAPAWEEADVLNSYPNPFTDQVTVAYRLSTPSQVVLDVYDVLGRRVARLVNQAVDMGEHHMVWDGRGVGGARLAGGVHFLRLTTTPLRGGLTRKFQRSVVQVR